MPRLVVLAGLPAAGKSTIARELAGRMGALWLRIDSMDRAIWASGTAPEDLQDWTYRAAQAVAEDNLRLGRDVIADAVNDWKEARDAWAEAGRRAGAEVVFIEIVCSDPAEHRQRVESRASDLPGLRLPGWDAVASRDDRPWDRERHVIDTAGRGAGEGVKAALAILARPAGVAVRHEE